MVSLERENSCGDLPITTQPAGVDSWSQIRNLHAASLTKLGGASIDAAQIRGFVDWIYSPDYTDALMHHNLTCGWYEGRLVGTSGWVSSNDHGESARITSVFVDPLFVRLGVARKLVVATEARARANGFRQFSTRAFSGATEFFEAMGYRRTSQGIRAVGDAAGIPIVYMRKDAAPLANRDGDRDKAMVGPDAGRLKPSGR